MYSKFEKLTDAIIRLWKDPFWMPFLILVWGWGMLAGSFAFGVAFVSIEGKEVGYVTALNWSVNYCLVIPLITFLVICLMHSLDKAVLYISERMAVLKATKCPLTDGERPRIPVYWLSFQRIIALLWVICIPIALSLSISGDWYPDVYRPMYEPSKLVDNYNKASLEKDWSTAALYPGNNATKLGCAIFSLLAYTMQVAPVMVALWLLLVIASFGIFVFRLAYMHPDFLLVPDVGSNDVRRGFEAFEPAGMIALLITLLIYLMAWFTILQNIYLSQQVDSINVLAFITEPIAMVGGGGLIQYLTATDTHLVNFSIAWALGCVIAILSTVLLFVPLVALSLSAFQARRNMYEIVQSLDNNQLLATFSSNRNSIIATLDSMKYWPFRYVSLNTLMVTAIILAMAIVWFRVSMYLATITVFYALIRARRKLRDVFES